MGHAEGGESFGGGCTLLEEVFPIVIECWEWEKWQREDRIENHRTSRPRFGRGELHRALGMSERSLGKCPAN